MVHSEVEESHATNLHQAVREGASKAKQQAQERSRQREAKDKHRLPVNNLVNIEAFMFTVLTTRAMVLTTRTTVMAQITPRTPL